MKTCYCQVFAASKRVAKSVSLLGSLSNCKGKSSFYYTMQRDRFLVFRSLCDRILMWLMFDGSCVRVSKVEWKEIRKEENFRGNAKKILLWLVHVEVGPCCGRLPMSDNGL